MERNRLFANTFNQGLREENKDEVDELEENVELWDQNASRRPYSQTRLLIKNHLVKDGKLSFMTFLITFL